MAGTKTGNFKELVSPYLRDLIKTYEKKYGINSKEYKSIFNQYLYDAREKNSKNSERSRHYQSEVKIIFENKELVGVERLYKKTILLEPTTVCAAHCRWCLRGQYPVKTMNKDQISHSTRYIGSKEVKKDVDEVLITGGDPLMSLPLLEYTLSELRNNAPNIKTIRIGTRVPVQDPKRINSKLIDILNIAFLKKKIEFKKNIKIGKFVINYNSRKLYKDDNFINLTEKETTIINFLKDSAKPVTIYDLQKKVWGYNSELETHTVETHVYRLRKKIFDNFKEKDFIKSYKNGYLIVSS